MPTRLVASTFAMLILAGCKPEPSRPTPAPAAAAAGAGATSTVPIKEIAVTDKGYEPKRIEAEAGKPVILRFTRKTKDTCGEQVVVQGDPVARMLPLDRPVDIRVVAPKAGTEIAFKCGMDMLHGALVAK